MSNEPEPAEIEALMRANLHEVFGERDPQLRAVAIGRAYAEDIVFSDPGEVAIGRDAVAAKVQKLLDETPGFTFTEVGPVYVSNDLGTLAWSYGPQGQPPVVTGFDICLIRDGVIARLYTILTPPKA
ncbi:nuclear transport factor 2 family protein [Promicromonospora sp. NFX87]|uniref:nuclear transport factor 2 family protein n=1 Tax=Promicromonospora sp. NFX87 TaxID=3402691 RepID=UPI003AFA6BB3